MIEVETWCSKRQSISKGSNNIGLEGGSSGKGLRCRGTVALVSLLEFVYYYGSEEEVCVDS